MGRPRNYDDAPNLGVSTHHMLDLKSRLRHRLVDDYHVHKMAESLFRKEGLADRADLEHATTSKLKRMIASLDEQPDADRSATDTAHLLEHSEEATDS